MKEFKVLDNRQNKLHTYLFDDVREIKGIVQILHGINEHGLRYKDFASFLNEHGYMVYVHDHVSQGYSRTEEDKENNTVDFGKHGKDVLLDGCNAVRKRIKEDFPHSPIYLFGHSLGSMIARYYLIKEENEYEKIIINGGGLSDTKGLGMGLFIGNVLKLFKAKKPSNFFDNTFRQTQLKLNEKVQIDHFIEWLTRDKEYTEVNKQDPFLYIRLTTRVFVDMLGLIKIINNHNNILNSHLDCEIMLLSGSHDPATNFGEDTLRLHEAFLQSGFKSRVKIYPEGRHDTVQELNKEEVFQDILDFIGGRV